MLQKTIEKKLVKTYKVIYFFFKDLHYIIKMIAAQYFPIR